MIIRSILELIAIGLLLYGIWHEDDLIVFEQKMLNKIKKARKK